jgi:hypothetical protein
MGGWRILFLFFLLRDEKLSKRRRCATRRFILAINMKAKDVFTPGTLPKHTYYDRSDLHLEQNLLDAVDTPGMIAAVSGPSKSGKTVLCESVIGLGSMLLVTGGGINSEDALGAESDPNWEFRRRLLLQVVNRKGVKLAGLQKLVWRFS